MTEILNTWVGDKVPLQARAVVGFGGIVVNDASVDVLDMIRTYMEKAAWESCGQCFPCRHGLKSIVQRLNSICEGVSENHAQNIQYLAETAKMIMASARCDIGQTSPKALLDIIENAPNLLDARKVTKEKYTSIVTAPCMNACPGHVNIPDYIEKIRTRQFDSGLSSVLEKCSMPGTIGRVCNRACESACKRGQNGSPLAIRHLKRFLFDRTPLSHVVDAAHAAPRKTQKIAIIGAGPSGLSCAFYLSKMGFPVTIFEKQEEAGGMAKYGIPDYRLPATVLEKEVECLKALGCEIRYGVDIGKDITLDELRQEKYGLYSAIFIATGAPNAPHMHCENEDACSIGYVSGINYLSQATKGNKIVSGNSVVVVGGGNVAMDCVRTALRHGFKDVQIVYRRTEDEMPADKMEIHEAKLEGVNFNFLAAPVSINHTSGQVTGLTCQKMELGEPDASGRRSPVAIKDATFELKCDVIIHAIGQKVAVDYLLEGLSDTTGTGLDKYNNLDADHLSGKVFALPHIFGGGDCVTGPKTLIAALAAGERAAEHIASYVLHEDIVVSEELKLEHALESIQLVDCKEIPAPKDLTAEMPLHVLPVDERLQGFSEVEHGSSDLEATTEAARCLRCLRILMIAS